MTVSRQTCVMYGDWSKRNDIKGHAPCPVKGLKEALRKRATVVSMDEFRTSKLCTQCHQTLSSARYSVDTRLPKRKKRKGVVLARSRAEVEFKNKKCYAVLRCDHKQCEARYLDRDVNTAINMLELPKSEVLEDRQIALNSLLEVHARQTMNWVVSEGTPTATVVWAAAERIGRAQSCEQLQKICDYLVNKHWFQTAGDLRSARQEAAEWQALEVPGRLKLAIQQVLEQTTPLYTEVPAYSYEEYYAAVRPSTETHDGEATEGGYNAGEETEQSLLACYTDGYDYATYDSAAGQYHYDPADSAATGAGDEHQQGEEVLQCDECDVVEAHAVEVESALGYEEGELVPDPSQCEGAVGGEPMGSIPATRIGEEVLTETWTCGQCTFLNPMAASFCEMCIGHISLSPEAQAAAASGSSIATPQPEPVVYAESSAVCVSPPPTALYLPSAPDFESSYLSEDDAMALPAPPPYGVSCGGDGVDFLALAFNTNSPPKIKTPSSSPLVKASQMRREEATTATEHTF